MARSTRRQREGRVADHVRNGPAASARQGGMRDRDGRWSAATSSVPTLTPPPPLSMTHSARTSRRRARQRWNSSADGDRQAPPYGEDASDPAVRAGQRASHRPARRVLVKLAGPHPMAPHPTAPHPITPHLTPRHRTQSRPRDCGGGAPDAATSGQPGLAEARPEQRRAGGRKQRCANHIGVNHCERRAGRGCWCASREVGQANGVHTHRRRPARLVAEKSLRNHHQVSTCVFPASASSPRSIGWPGRQFFGRRPSFRNRGPLRHSYVSFTSRSDAPAATAWLLACMTRTQPHWQMGGRGEMKRGRWLPSLVWSGSRDASPRRPQWPSAPSPTGGRRTLLAVPAGLEGRAGGAKRPLGVHRTR